MTRAITLTMLLALGTSGFTLVLRAHAVAAALPAAAGAAVDQAAGSVWDGVYAVAQARRGAGFAERCRACHGFDLEGGVAPSLMGREFVARWDGRTLADLFERIEVNFAAPGDAATEAARAASVRQQSVDFLAYLLIANGFPAGAAELPAASERLKALRVLASRP